MVSTQTVAKLDRLRRVQAVRAGRSGGFSKCGDPSSSTAGRDARRRTARRRAPGLPATAAAANWAGPCHAPRPAEAPEAAATLRTHLCRQVTSRRGRNDDTLVGRVVAGIASNTGARSGAQRRRLRAQRASATVRAGRRVQHVRSAHRSPARADGDRDRRDLLTDQRARREQPNPVVIQLASGDGRNNLRCARLCTTTDAGDIRPPRNKSEGNPLTAISTAGRTVQRVLLKMGVDQVYSRTPAAAHRVEVACTSTC